MTSRQPRTILEASLYDDPVLVVETGQGELAGHREIEARAGAWKLTGAWTRGSEIDGGRVERWLRGLRPQNGARDAQDKRARDRREALGISRTAPDQGDIIWATPHMEYPGAVSFRSLFGNGEELEPEPKLEHALSAENLERLLDQVIEEMRRGTIDPRMLNMQPITPSGSLPKFAVHRSPIDGQWYLPDRTRLSTHIVKHEDRADVPAEAAVEAVCQRALGALGVRTATTQATIIGHRQVVVSERTDRFVDEENAVVRAIHQEEWACACGRDPDELIQRQGTNGGWADLYRFVTRNSIHPADEREHFWTALAALVLVGHRDIHRRNVAVRYPYRNRPESAELAPLYDVASMDGQRDQRWRSLGLVVGGEEEIERIGEAEWVTMAKECQADPDEVLGLVTDTARRLPEAIEGAIARAHEEDHWREGKAALHRIEELRKGTDKRARRARRATVRTRATPAVPDWLDLVIEAVHAGGKITFEANESSFAMNIWAHHEDGTTRTLGTAQSPAAYYRALQRAGAVPAEDVPHLIRTLEREREKQIAIARARGHVPG